MKNKSIFYKLIFTLFLFGPSFLYNWHSSFLFISILLVAMWELSSIWFIVFAVYIAIAEIFHTHVHFNWGGNHIGSRIELIFDSPSYEIYEYLQTYISYIDIIIIIYMLLLFSIFLKYKDNKIFKNNIKIRYKPIYCLMLISILIIKMSSTSPLNAANIFFKSIDRNNILHERLENIKNHQYDFTHSDIYDKIVIIIGESASKNHMSIYNYNKLTTPFMSSINPYVFNAITPANQTRLAIPLILTNANTSDWNSFFKEPSLVSILNNMGYKTHWLSNQRARGKNDTYVASMAHEADEIFFFLIGSHSKYSSRYEKNISLSKNNNTIIDHYDNTIYYTDYIISKIYNHFKSFKDEKILIVYFSDHGEVVSEEKNGHGFSPSYRDSYEIPFVVYSSIENNYLKTLTKTNDIKTINLESFPNILINMLNEKDIHDISYSSNVLSVETDNIVDYKDLNYYNLK